MTTIRAGMMQRGDRVLVEPLNAANFEATVTRCRGWSVVHGVMDWQMARDDGTEFVYSMPVDAPVELTSYVIHD